MRTWRGRDAGRGISARHTKHRKQRHTWWSNTSSSRRYFLFFSLVLVLSFTRGSRGLSPALTNKSFRSTSSSGTADFWFISSSTSSSPDPSLVTEGSDIGRNFISKVFYFSKKRVGDVDPSFVLPLLYTLVPGEVWKSVGRRWSRDDAKSTNELRKAISDAISRRLTLRLKYADFCPFLPAEKRTVNVAGSSSLSLFSLFVFGNQEKKNLISCLERAFQVRFIDFHLSLSLEKLLMRRPRRMERDKHQALPFCVADADPRRLYIRCAAPSQKTVSTPRSLQEWSGMSRQLLEPRSRVAHQPQLLINKPTVFYSKQRLYVYKHTGSSTTTTV